MVVIFFLVFERRESEKLIAINYTGAGSFKIKVVVCETHHHSTLEFNTTGPETIAYEY